MQAWHKAYYRGVANEQAALARAKQSDLGEYYIGTDGEEYIAWPNGEISTAEEHNRWLAGKAIEAQYGRHG